MASVLGPMEDRVRVDMRLSPYLSERLEEVSRKLGVPKAAIQTLALARFLIEFAPLEGRRRKRAKVLGELEDIFQTTIENIREDL